MKRLFTLLLAISFATGIFSQAPEKMSYQAVVRDVTDELVKDRDIGMQISILYGTTSGKAIYVETQTPTTNGSGLVSIEIGTGTIVSGDFTTIDWTNGPYFIKTETDPDGDINYTITGTSQLLSVPYAMHAKTAESVTGEITESQISDLKTYYLASNPDGFISDYTVTEEDVTAHQGALKITESQITDLDHFTTADETDPSVPSGTQTGEMQYWDGSEWIIVERGSSGQVLTLVNGKPTWGGISSAGAGEVQNPTTGAIWMDRNLGASQVATSSTDTDAYGDLYQWGRAADGHELRTSSTTSTNATTAVPNAGNSWDGLFITAGSSPYDWLTPQDDNLWQGVSGTNNPCPSGYRLPTDAEWDTERTSWSSDDAAGAFGSPLRLTLAGRRYSSNGSLDNVGSNSSYWSSTVDGTYSRYLFFYSSYAYMYSYHRAFGYSVRCIKD